MGNVEKILRHMFHSRYVFFRPHTIAQHIHLEERRVIKIVENMKESGVIERISNDDNILYFLTPTSMWILKNLLGWRC